MKAKHKFLSVLLVLCMVSCMVPAAVFAADNVPDSVWTDYAAAEFAGGTGTEQDPYQIATAEQLAKLSKDVSEGTNYQGTYFVLTENINLSSHRWVPIGIYKWESTRTTTTKNFQGFIDGNNKTISGLIVDERTDKYSAGFFGNIRNIDGGTVGAKDLTISSANIYANEDGLEQLYAGILAGYALTNPDKQIVFENISVSGTVVVERTVGNNNVGGMIGYGTRVKATNCNAEKISVTGASNSGGFIGNDSGSVFTNCKATGTVSGAWGLGGFVGYTSTATYQAPDAQSVYEKCAADVGLEGSDWRLGGFAGYAEYGRFDNCVAFGDVASTVDGWEPKVGGFIGESDSVAATACHATGTVTSESSTYEAGGFVGCYTGGTFEGCSFDNEKNSGLTAAGTGTISAGVEGGNSNDVLANICEDYYGGHQYSTEWTIDTAATCTTDGSKSQHCERCNTKSNITVIPATGHIMQKTDKVEATCTTAGKEAYYTCEVCQKHFEDEAGNTEITDLENYGVIEKTGHTMQKTDKVEATCTTAGKEAYYTCEVCQKHFEDEAGNTEITDLENYGVIEKTGHTMQKTDKVEATCTTAGKEAYYTCEVCQKHFSDAEGNNEITNLEEYGIIQATEHKAGTEWKHNETSHWNECMNNCGEKLNEAAHSYEWVVDKEATATEAGSKHEECTVCGYKKAAVTIPTTTEPSKPNPDTRNDDTKSPQTGDNSHLALWFALMVASCGGILGAAFYGKKKKEQV